MGVNMPPELTSHCTVGFVPLATAFKVTCVPTHAVTAAGFVVITGAVCTFRLAGNDVARLHVLTNTARYCLASSPVVAVNMSVGPVAPATSANERPSLLTCH